MSTILFHTPFTSGNVEEGQALAKAEQRASSAKSTLSDLESKRANVEGARDTAIGDQFMEGRKASERASTTLTSATTGASVDAVRPAAAVYNAVQKGREAIVNFIVAWKGLGTAVTVVSQIFQSVFVAVLLGSAANMVKMIGFLGRAAVSFIGVARAGTALSTALGLVGGALRLVTGPVGLPGGHG